MVPEPKILFLKSKIWGQSLGFQFKIYKLCQSMKLFGNQDYFYTITPVKYERTIIVYNFLNNKIVETWVSF